jgi:hypothetical protein
MIDPHEVVDYARAVTTLKLAKETNAGGPLPL